MTRSFQGTDHVWLVMMKAMRALTKYAVAGIEETGLGLSDFGVLEILLHKGPLPVNTIGPIVDLTPGSISTAVDRLVAKGLVSRVESAEDRRVRIVALTVRGKDLIASSFRKHSGQMKRVFSELTPEELRRSRSGAEESRQARRGAHKGKHSLSSMLFGSFGWSSNEKRQRSNGRKSTSA